jgi:hypothetical protein
VLAIFEQTKTGKWIARVADGKTLSIQFSQRSYPGGDDALAWQIDINSRVEPTMPFKTRVVVPAPTDTTCAAEERPLVEYLNTFHL